MKTALSIALVTETYPPELNGVALTVERALHHLLERGHRVGLVRPRQAADRIGMPPATTPADELRGCGYRHLACVGRGVDADLFSPRRRSAALRARWGVGAGQLAVLARFEAYLAAQAASNVPAGDVATVA